jgi:hypothetical protein
MTKIFNEDEQCWQSLRTRGKSHLKLKLSNDYSALVRPAGMLLWADFPRKGQSYLSSDLIESKRLNIFRDPVHRVPSNVRFNQANGFNDRITWRDLDQLVRSRNTSGEATFADVPNELFSRAVVTGLEALIIGAPGIRRWRSVGK